MADICTSCAGMAGGGVEFFEQNWNNAQFTDSLSKDIITCQKDYNGCVYSAQGAIMCGKNNNKVNKNSVGTEKFTEQSIPMPPGMSLGGLPNIPALPNFDALTNANNSAPTKSFY
jgi:hypothetical protein